MRVVVNLFGGLIAFGWAMVAADYAAGARRSHRLDRIDPIAPSDAAAPSISVVVAACNEIEKMPRAFRSLLAQNYPGPMQIVAVDDRSTDGTSEALDLLARETPPGKSVVILHLRHLPDGWLGKTHALWRGARRATGEYLLFTDADIVFQPDTLARAIGFAEREHLDHLVSFFSLDLRGFWEHAFGLCFGFLFFLRFRPWHVRNPKRAEYLGVGGFNLVRRTAYDAIGTHRAIALDVADDMELGRKLKQAGFASDVIGAADHIVVRWQEGLTGLMGGLVKNAYATSDFSILSVSGSIALLLATIFWPFIGVFAAPSTRSRIGYGTAAATFLGLGAWHARTLGIAPAYALTLPVTTLMLAGVMIRSAYVTEKNGGITWRGTFYPIDVLRERAIPPVPDDTDA